MTPVLLAVLVFQVFALAKGGTRIGGSRQVDWNWIAVHELAIND
jgi:hypothetical protein